MSNSSEQYSAASAVSAATTPKLITNLNETVQNVAGSTASEGNLYGVHFQNANATAVFVQIFDALAANVIIGTTVPKISFWVPGSGGYDLWPTVAILHWGNGTGLSAAATTTATGSTDPGASDIIANFFYKN